MSTEAQTAATATETAETTTSETDATTATEGAATAATPKPGEKANEAPPERLSKAKAALASVRARAAAHKQKAASESKVSAELAAVRSELAEAKQATTALKKLAELAESDPYMAMKHLGITPDGLMMHGTAEAQQERALKEIADRAKKAEERAEALEKQMRDEKISAVIENDRKAVREALKTDDFPKLKAFRALSARTEGWIFSEVDRIRTEAHRSTGDWYPIDEVLALLEDEFSQGADQDDTATSQKPQNGTAGRAPGDAKAPKSRTLTNQQASVSNTTPPNLDQLTREQRLERVTKKIGDKWRSKRSA